MELKDLEFHTILKENERYQTESKYYRNGKFCC